MSLGRLCSMSYCHKACSMNYSVTRSPDDSPELDRWGGRGRGGGGEGRCGGWWISRSQPLFANRIACTLSACSRVKLRHYRNESCMHSKKWLAAIALGDVKTILLLLAYLEWQLGLSFALCMCIVLSPLLHMACSRLPEQSKEFCWHNVTCWEVHVCSVCAYVCLREEMEIQLAWMIVPEVELLLLESPLVAFMFVQPMLSDRHIKRQRILG